MKDDQSGSTPVKGGSNKAATGGASLEEGLSMKQMFKAPAIDETQFGQPKPEKLSEG